MRLNNRCKSTGKTHTVASNKTQGERTVFLGTMRAISRSIRGTGFVLGRVH